MGVGKITTAYPIIDRLHGYELTVSDIEIQSMELEEFIQKYPGFESI
jgi:hypothetical protein